jgi:hypothetical protein
MGAWSEHAFGNDTACDWAGDFVDDPGLDKVRSAIEAVLESDDYLDSDPACECLVACEIVARLQGRWGLRDSYSEDVDAWILANPMPVPQELRDAAIAAIDRILGEDSELPQLWDDGGPNAEWHQAMDDLRKRVAG